MVIPAVTKQRSSNNLMVYKQQVFFSAISVTPLVQPSTTSFFYVWAEKITLSLKCGIGKSD